MLTFILKYYNKIPTPRIPNSTLFTCPEKLVRPLFYAATDYGGSYRFFIERIRAKVHKAYIFLFICMDIKVIPSTLVSGLYINTSLSALHRFFTRCEVCIYIYSEP